MTTQPTTSPESICVSLEKAKKLKEAGWEEETVWQWQYARKGSSTTTGRTWYLRPYLYRTGRGYVAAPIASELWRFMPVGTTMTKKKNCTRITIPCIVPTSSGVNSHAYESKREQDALAYMWIYLSTHNLLKP